jgi:prepilin-type N-terminal cleavage/methylation domain-containing protein
METIDSKHIQPKDQRGYTLIEVAIAMAIFAIGILAIASLQVRAINHNQSARWATEAENWAQDQVEALMGLNYDNALLSLGTHPAVPIRIEGGYRLFWDVADNSANVPNTKLITVTVRRDSAMVGRRTVNLTFVKADNVGGTE